MKKTYLIENFVKNILLITSFAAMYRFNLDFFKQISAEFYPPLLTVVSIMIVGALFACYTFTYAHTKLGNIFYRYIGHLLTFLVSFCVGILLEVMVIIVNLMVGTNMLIFSLTAILFYISLMLYDFWDLFRHAEFGPK